MSQPTNAYELCAAVCEAIAAHPLNYYQDYWCTPRRDLPKSLAVKENECGTAFCRAGWMTKVADGTLAGLVSKRAFELLGCANDDGDEYYADDIWALFECFEDEHADLVPGSPSYVAEGVAGMRRFMARHEARLKATPIRAKGEA